MPTDKRCKIIRSVYTLRVWQENAPESLYFQEKFYMWYRKVWQRKNYRRWIPTASRVSKVCSAFDTKETPHSYYLSLIMDPIDAQTQHEQWIAAIRDATWERTFFEESSVTSLDAFRYLFKRGLIIGVRLFLLK